LALLLIYKVFMIGFSVISGSVPLSGCLHPYKERERERVSKGVKCFFTILLSWIGYKSNILANRLQCKLLFGNMQKIQCLLAPCFIISNKCIFEQSTLIIIFNRPSQFYIKR
jgi:hypothetical protein